MGAMVRQTTGVGGVACTACVLEIRARDTLIVQRPAVQHAEKSFRNRFSCDATAQTHDVELSGQVADLRDAPSAASRSMLTARATVHHTLVSVDPTRVADTFV